MAAAIKVLQICDRTHDFVQGLDLSEEIVRGLVAAGFDTTFAVLTGAPDPELAKRVGCPTHHFGLANRQLKPSNLRTLYRLARYIHAGKFDVVITHRFKPWLLLAWINLLLPRVRLISVLHAFKQFDRPRRQRLARWLLKPHSRFVAVSQAVKDDLVAHRIPAANIVVIPNSIDVESLRAQQLSRSAARAELGLSPDACVIGTIGRTKPIKGHRFLVEAFAQVHRQHPDCQLLIVGGGELEPALQQQIETAGLSASARLTGAIPNAARLLLAFDYFVLPSLLEGFGLAVLEAVASGLPIIATRVGGVPEAMGADGILVAPHNSDQLAQALLDMLSWPASRRADYVRKLQEHLDREFRIEHYHQRFAALVTELATAPDA